MSETAGQLYSRIVTARWRRLKNGAGSVDGKRVLHSLRRPVRLSWRPFPARVAAVSAFVAALLLAQPAGAAPAPSASQLHDATAKVHAAEQTLSEAEHEVESATRTSQQLAYAVVALRARQAQAQVDEDRAREQARKAVRLAFDGATVDPTDNLFAALSGDDPGLATQVRERRLSNAAGHSRALQAAVARLDELNQETNRKQDAALKAAARAIGAADTARSKLEDAEAADTELRRQAAIAAQREELARLKRQLAASLAALQPSGSTGGGGTMVPDANASVRALYQQAALTCPGLPWGVLAGIGQVETDHGANKNVSSAGAMGPMQFMPATWEAYGVDGDGDGKADILNQTDAVYSAAHYLCSNGGGNSASLYKAIFAYNHSSYYVNTVLRLAAQYK